MIGQRRCCLVLLLVVFYCSSSLSSMIQVSKNLTVPAQKQSNNNGFVEKTSQLDERLDPLFPQTQENGIQETGPVLDAHLDPIKKQETTSDEEIYISTCSDEKYEQKFDVKISGFVKYDAFFDSRQVIAYNRGLLMVVPKIPKLDPAGADINDHTQWNMLGLQSRVLIDVTGPKLGYAKTSARIGFDFADPLDEGLFRIRFAYMQFVWDHIKNKNKKLILGHYYHPISLDEAYPDTLGYSQGELFDPFTYAGQATIYYTFNDITLIGSLNSDWKYTPARNAAFPDMFFATHIKFCDAHYAGIGIDFHREVPRIQTDPTIATSGQSFATSNALNSWSGYVFAACNFEHFKGKVRFSYIENGIRYCMLGGVGTKASNYNPVTDQRHYTNLRALAWWTELIYRYKKAECGIFIGYTKNIGSRDVLVTNPDGTADLRFIEALYEGAAQTDNVIKIQPRLRYYLDPIEFGVELEFCRAKYGTVNKFGRVDNAAPVSDARILFAIFYKF